MLCMTLALGCGVLGTAAACGGDSGDNGDNGGSGSSVESSAPESESSEESTSSEESSEAPETNDYVYRVTVENETGFGFRGLSVSLYDGETLIASKTTNSLGNANFTAEDVASVGTYSIVIDELPAGYEYLYGDLTYETVSIANTTTLIQLTPTGVINEKMPLNHRYTFGNVMYDFTLTLSDGTQFTLSEELQTKDVVLINFWATWCTPCKQEFPAMHNAATLYEDDVTVLALSTSDGNQAVENFKSTNGFTKFRMGSAPLDLMNAFSVSGIPHSIMVDRYGVVSFVHVGSMTATSDFTAVFDRFNTEDYKSIVLGTPDDTDIPDIPPDDNFVPPTEDVLAKMPVSDKVKETLNADGNFSFRFQEKDAEVGSDNYDDKTWPWLVSEDGEYLYAPNANFHNSYATLYVDFTAQVGDVLCFDYLLGSEDGCDILYVSIDGVPIHQLSGYHTKAWQTCYAYVFQDGEAGEHEMSLVFLKDNDTTAYEDIVQIDNLRIENLTDIENDANVDANIFRYAASGLNTAEDAKTQYTRYITPVYNEDDGYYHVGDKNGPILLANMLRASQWSNNSVWLLAYNDYVVDEDGANYRSAIEYYAWEANNSIRMLGYTPVTEELRLLLEITVDVVTADQKWDGANHANEWLECCVYYDHYGATAPMEDPLRGITFAGAIEMHEGDNQIEVLFEMVPRGFKYKFTPSKTGVYKVYSTGTYDTMVYLTNKTILDNCPIQDRLTSLPFLGTYNDKLFMETIIGDNGEETVDYNFEFYYRFQEGETYYMLFTTYDNKAATYNVTIEYEGETYKYLQYASSNLYSANENTGAEYLPDAVDYYYSDPASGGDGYYHESKTHSILYLDVNRPTFFNQNYSLYDICRSAIQNNIPVEERAFYVDGVDYTTALMAYCQEGMFNDEMQGFVPVTQELMTLLQTITMKRYEGIEKSWLMMCYYYVTLGV